MAKFKGEKMGWLTKTITSFGLLSLFMAAPVCAYEVQPMRHTLMPGDGKTSSLITVKNTREDPLPVEPVFQKRRYLPEGGFEALDNGEDFLIFPPQALIAPGQTQSFRFQYIGEDRLEQEKAYTLLVKEVPVELEKGFTGLRYLYDFGVAVYIEDSKMQSILSVGGVKREANRLDFWLENSGNSFARLQNDRFRLIQGERKIDLEGTALTELLTQSVIPPKSRIPVSMNIIDLGLAEGDISVRLDEKPD